MKLFASFCKSDMLVEHVAIYPTELGLKRMKEDARYGPRIKAVAKKQKEEQREEVIEDIFEKGKKEERETPFDPKALRKYEIEEMGYYYAVVTVDSVKTADYLYEECGGVELE